MPIEEPIRDEVHAPALVDASRLRSLAPGSATLVSSRRLNPHLQALLDVQPVHELVIDLPALSFEQRVQSAVAVPHPAGGQVPKSDPKFGPTVANAPVTL